MATTSNNTLSQYSLSQKQQDNCNQNSSKSPSPTMVPQPHLHPHSSITLPSIHSLDIPAFPHFEEYNRASFSANMLHHLHPQLHLLLQIPQHC